MLFRRRVPRLLFFVCRDMIYIRFAQPKSNQYCPATPRATSLAELKGVSEMVDFTDRISRWRLLTDAQHPSIIASSSIRFAAKCLSHVVSGARDGALEEENNGAAELYLYSS